VLVEHESGGSVPAPAISIVVVTRGPSLLLARLFRSLGRAEDVEQVELLVGLNGSNGADGTRALAARYLPTTPLHVLQLPKVSPGQARNDVVREAGAPVLLFLDDDVEVLPDILVHTQEIMSDESVAVAGGPNLTPPTSPAFEHLAGQVLGSALGAGPVRHRYTVGAPDMASERQLILCNLAVRRSVFADAEFDGDLQCAEENELLARLAQAGFKMVYRPELAVYHHRRQSLRSHLRQMAKYGLGRGQVLVRALATSRGTHALPALALACVLAAGALQPSVLATAVAAYAAVVVGGSVRFGRFRRGPTVLALFLATHFGYALGVLAGLAYEARQVVRRLLAAGEGRLGRDAAATFGALMLTILGGVGAGVVIARALGPEGRGLFELGRIMAVVVALVAGMGLGRAAVFLRPRGLITDGGVYGAVASALGSGTVAGGALAATLLLTRSWHGFGVGEIALAAGSVPLIAFFAQGQSALQGIGQAAWFRRTLATREALFLTLLVIAFSLHTSVFVALVAWWAHWFGSALFIAWLLARNCGRPRVPAGAIGRLVAFGASQAVVVLLMQAHLRLDVFVVQGFHGSAELGYYAVAFGLADLLAYGGRAVGLALYPRTAFSSAADPAGGARRTARALRVVLIFALAGAGAIAVAGPSLVELLFGPRFAPAGVPLRVLLPGTVALSLLVILQSDLSGRGRIKSVMASGLAVVTANLALTFVLVPGLGATGAALASSITYTTGAALLLIVFSRATQVPLRDCIIPRRRDAQSAARSLFGNRPAMSGSR
jgi:O-antigen/teichoic acid export membrane protein/GT2 family glycosyltransferase